MARYELNEIFNTIFDRIGGVIRTSDHPSSLQQIIEEASATTTYVGVAVKGLATTDDGWLVTKVVTSAGTTTESTAVGPWSNRASLTYS